MTEEIQLLRKQKDLAEMLNSASIDQILAFNTNLEIITWNKACETETGLWKEAVIGKNFLKVFSMMDADEEIISAIRLTLQGFKTFVPARAGSYRRNYFEHHFVPLRNDEGIVIGVMSIIHNVAHRVKSENELKGLNRSLDHFKRIIETTHDAVISLNNAGLVTYWNPAAEKLYGFSADEMMGKRLTEAIIPPGKVDEFTDLSAKMATGEIVIDLVTQRSDRKGQLIDVMINFFPIRNEDNNIIGSCSIAKDITEHLRATDRLEALNLELQVKNRDLGLANAELKGFTEVAVNHYSETLKNLYVSMEHLVSNDAQHLSNNGKANLRRSQSAVQKLKLLTEDTVAFSTITELAEGFGDVDVETVLRQVLEDFKPRLENYSITVQQENLQMMTAYPSLFLLLLRHLLDNAIKFRAESVTPLIKVYQHCVGKKVGEANGTYKNFNVLTVEDNGIGFEPADKDRIFNLFTSLHSGKYKGSGLGLAACKKIMGLHGGFISAESKPGKGAAFHCYFPFKQLQG